MPTRDLSNQRIGFWLGTSTAVANLAAPTAAEVAAMLPAHKAIRWDGLDFGMKASNKLDDRTLDDNATAQIRSFMQFGGSIPFFFPKKTDSTSILRQVFNLVKAPNTQLVCVERVGFQDRNTAYTAGDNFNSYAVLTGSYSPDTSGANGYAYLENMVPQGTVYPWGIAPAASPATVAIVGGATLSLSLAGVNIGLRGATYQGNNVAPRVVWSSSAPNIATVDNRGVIRGVAIGTANITATIVGGTTSTAVAVTVAA